MQGRNLTPTTDIVNGCSSWKSVELIVDSMLNAQLTIVY